MTVRWLGQEDAKPIPWQCWDAPGFKACHAKAYAEAAAKFNKDAYESDADYFIDLNETVNYLAMKNCGHLCPKVAGASSSSAPTEPAPAGPMSTSAGAKKDKTATTAVLLGVVVVVGVVGAAWYTHTRNKKDT